MELEIREQHPRLDRDIQAASGTERGWGVSETEIKAHWTPIGEEQWHPINITNLKSLESIKRLVVQTMSKMEMHNKTGDARYLFRIQSRGAVWYVWKNQTFLNTALGEPWKPSETDLQAERMEHLKRWER